jgi:hypothetical protein
VGGVGLSSSSSGRVSRCPGLRSIADSRGVIFVRCPCVEIGRVSRIVVRRAGGVGDIELWDLSLYSLASDEPLAEQPHSLDTRYSTEQLNELVVIVLQRIGLARVEDWVVALGGASGARVAPVR